MLYVSSVRPPWVNDLSIFSSHLPVQGSFLSLVWFVLCFDWLNDASSNVSAVIYSCTANFTMVIIATLRQNFSLVLHQMTNISLASRGMNCTERWMVHQHLHIYRWLNANRYSEKWGTLGESLYKAKISIYSFVFNEKRLKMAGKLHLGHSSLPGTEKDINGFSVRAVAWFEVLMLLTWQWRLFLGKCIHVEMKLNFSYDQVHYSTILWCSMLQWIHLFNLVRSLSSFDSLTEYLERNEIYGIGIILDNGPYSRKADPLSQM